MKFIKHKRGYFFTLDAILALSVLSVGVFLTLSTYNSNEPTDQVESLSNDLLDYLVSSTIEDTNNPYIGVGGDLWEQGIVTNADNTLLEQIGVFYTNGNVTFAHNTIKNITESTTFSLYTYEVWINYELIYPINASASHNLSKNQTDILLRSSKIVQGFMDEESGTLFGPYAAEVFVWQSVN